MKKIIILGLILLGLNCSPLLVRADVIPDNTHRVDKCPKVVNLSDFPDIVLIAGLKSSIGGGSSSRVINENECFPGGYMTTLNIYWNTKDIINENNLLLENVDFKSDFVDKNDPLIKKNIEYSLFKSPDGVLKLEKSKIISEYSNGKTPKVEIFSNDYVKKVITENKIEKNNIQEIKSDLKESEKDDIKDLGNKIEPIKIPSKISFWQFIKCFFGFSKNC